MEVCCFWESKDHGSHDHGNSFARMICGWTQVMGHGQFGRIGRSLYRSVLKSKNRGYVLPDSRLQWIFSYFLIKHVWHNCFCTQNTVIPLLYVISMSISAFFLLLTAVVYVLLWDKHNVHGRTISCHVSSMFFLYVFLALSFFLGQLLVVEVTIPEPDIELEAEVNGSGFEYHVNNESEHFVEEVQVNFGEGSTACTVIGMSCGHLPRNAYECAWFWLMSIGFQIYFYNYRSNRPFLLHLHVLLVNITQLWPLVYIQVHQASWGTLTRNSTLWPVQSVRMGLPCCCCCCELCYGLHVSVSNCGAVLELNS